MKKEKKNARAGRPLEEDKKKLEGRTEGEGDWERGEGGGLMFDVATPAGARASSVPEERGASRDQPRRPRH